VGQQSVIAPQNCDGVALTDQGSYSASRFLRDFQIIGNNTDDNVGIMANMSAASRNRVTGIQFSNITIQNFGVGVFARGIWNSSFRDCFLYNNFCGYHFHGQSVVNSISGGFVQRGSIAGSGTCYGVLVDSVDGESCQSLHMNAVGIYAYDVNISLALALYSSIENCDVSVANTIGVQLIGVFGGTTVRDCWIQTNGSAATTGIQIADRQAAAQDKIVVDGCMLVCNISNDGSVGVYVGYNQLGVTTNNNTIGIASGAFATGISNGGAHNHVAKFNTIYSKVRACLVSSSASGVEMGPNTIQNGNPLEFTGRTPKNFGYYANGVFTLELGGMSAKARGVMDWVAIGRTVHLCVSDEQLMGISNSGEMIGTGLPAYLSPNLRRCAPVLVVDKGVRGYGEAFIDSDGRIVFKKDANGAEFANSGTKGLPIATTIAYIL
jgi:hypothetical protein